MSKITWVNFLHFYQPPTASNEVVLEAVDKSYRRIIVGLQKNPQIKFTFNITGCLLEKLRELGQDGLINDIKNLVSKGQIELTGSAAYHPILPLLPEEEIVRQIKINEEILHRYFGDIKLPGFFAPEATYGIKMAKIVKKIGFSWLVLDEISAMEKIQPNILYTDKNSCLNLCFRSRTFSQNYVPKILMELPQKNQENFIVTATDAELYGLRHLDISANYEKIISPKSAFKTFTISEYLKSLSEKKNIILRPSSWESSEEELRQGQPYALWQNKKNRIHTKLWELTNFIIKTIKKFDRDTNIVWARHHLDRGLASCTFWWASNKDFQLFGAPAWNPDQIETGVNELLKSIRSIADTRSRDDKLTAEKLGISIMQTIWKDHWTKYWKK